MSVNILRQVVSETEAGFIKFATNHYEQHRQSKISFVCSGCLICIIWRGTIYIANVGDSRAILGSHKSVGPIKRLRVKQMVRDHNCDNLDIRDELAALHPDDNQICFYNFGAWRVKGLSEVLFCLACNLPSSISKPSNNISILSSELYLYQHKILIYVIHLHIACWLDRQVDV